MEMCEKEVQREAEKRWVEMRRIDKKQKKKKEKKMIEKKKKVKEERGKEKKQQDPIRMLLEEYPILLIRLVLFLEVHLGTREKALSLTEEFLQQGYWVSSRVL